MRDSIEPRESSGDDAVHVHGGQIGPVHFRSVFMGARAPSRTKLIALAILALALGGVFLALGLILLTALAAAGVVFGGGYLIWRRVRGALGGRSDEPAALELDPAMEIRTSGVVDPSRALPHDRDR